MGLNLRISAQGSFVYHTVCVCVSEDLSMWKQTQSPAVVVYSAGTWRTLEKRMEAERKWNRIEKATHLCFDGTLIATLRWDPVILARVRVLQPCRILPPDGIPLLSVLQYQSCGHKPFPMRTFRFLWLFPLLPFFFSSSDLPSEIQRDKQNKQLFVDVVWMFSFLAPICCVQLEQKQLPYLLTSVWKTDACIPA